MRVYAFIQFHAACHIYIKPLDILPSLKRVSRRERVVVENFMIELKPFREIDISFRCESDDFGVFVDFTTTNTFSN